MNFVNLNLAVHVRTRSEFQITASAEAWSSVTAQTRLPRTLVEQTTIRTRAEAERFGESLFRVLFAQGIYEYYRRVREFALQQDKALRLRLSFDDVRAARLAWEYLCEPQTKQFLAFDPQISLVRHPPTGQLLPQLLVHPPLKILAVISQPRDFETLDTASERANLENGLNSLVADGAAQITWLTPPTKDALREAIAADEYHILHFIGHGGIHQATQESGIILARENGMSVHLSSTDLAMLTLTREPLRVVILNACATGTTVDNDAFGSVAATLVQKGGVAAVVAMQAQITDAASLAFTQGFYQILARGQRLDDAVREGRKAIYLRANEIEFATPALYLHATDGALLVPLDETELPRLEAIPDVPRLFGREQEIEMYRAMLESTNRVIIEGMAGVGKTTVGAALARVQQAQGRRVFWISFDAANKNNGELLVWELAGFLKRNSKPQLWDALRQEATSSERNAVRRFTLLINSLEEGNFTLCFDDLHLVLDDPLINQLFSSVQKQYQDHPEKLPAQFIVMTRRVPTYMEHLSGEPLGGLTLQDLRAWLEAEGLEISPQLSKRLYDKVQGNPHFTRLALTGLARYVRDPAALERRIDDLEIQSNVHDYLMAKVYELLENQDRHLVDELSVFDTFVPSELVKQISVGENINNVARRLRELVQRNVVLERQETQEFGLHALVRDWCYENLDADVRQRLHEKAGEYFERTRVWASAARHFAQAAQYERAAKLLTDNVDEMMYLGNLETVVSLMPGLMAKELPHKLYVKSVYTMARALAAMGKDKEAIPLLEYAAAESKDEVHIQALTSLGESLRVLGEFERANQVLRQATEHVDIHRDPVLSARVLEGLGWTEYRLGNLDSAESALRRALEIAEQNKQPMLAAHSRLRLGQVLQERGQFEQAYELELNSLREFQKAGQLRNQADAYLALGYSCSALGEYTKAEDFYRQAIQLLEMLEDDYGIMMGLNDLGDLLRMNRKFSEAISLLERAAALAETGNYKYMVVVVELSFADLYIDQKDFVNACARAESALAKARQWKFVGLTSTAVRTLNIAKQSNPN